MSNQKYDVISSEPSNPWMAGLASLFTRECFELAKAHLNDGGIFVQFTHAYQMDWHTFAMIGRTFSEVFPNSMLVNTDPTTNGPDYLLIGIKGEKKLDANVAAQNLKYAQRSKNVTLPRSQALLQFDSQRGSRKALRGWPHSYGRPTLPRICRSETPLHD